MIEKAVSRVDGVKSADINFMTTKMTLDCEDDKVCAITQAVEKIIKKMEPDVKVVKI
jgi:Cd2+/Zn2+-exporting ATPase